MTIRYNIPSSIHWTAGPTAEEGTRLQQVILSAIRRAVEGAAGEAAEIAVADCDTRTVPTERFESTRYRSGRNTYDIPSYQESGAPTEVPVEEHLPPWYCFEGCNEGIPSLTIYGPSPMVWFTFSEGRFLVRIRADWLAANVYGVSEEEATRLREEKRRPDIDKPSLPVEYLIEELESRTSLRLLPAARMEIEAQGRIPLEEYQDFHYAIFLNDADLVRWFGVEQWSQYLQRPPGMPESVAATGREGSHPVEADRSVFGDNPGLAALYLFLMEHFTGLDITTEINTMVRNGLDVTELAAIIGDHPTRGVLTDIFTQGWREYRQAGGTDVIAFEPLIERILEQYLRGNLNAMANRLKIGHGLPERDLLGIVHRDTGLLLYDEIGMPLPSRIGIGMRDEGYLSFNPPEFMQSFAEAMSELGLSIRDSDALLMNLIGQVYVGETAMVAQAARAVWTNIQAVGQRVLGGLGAEVRQAAGEALEVFVLFMLGHATSRLLMRIRNPLSIAIGLALEGLLRAAGHIMGIEFLGQTWDILVQAAFHMSRVQNDENGRPTRLSELHMDRAAQPIQQLIANLAVAMGTIALAKALGRIRTGNSRGIIEDPNRPIREEIVDGEPAKYAQGPEAVRLPAGFDQSTLVWVNTRTGRYHLPGTQWYRNTLGGRLMTLEEAESEGYRGASSKLVSSAPPPTSGVYSVERPTLGDPRVVIRSWIGESQARAGLEREMASAAENSINEIRNWQRAHSQPPCLGVECGEAIRLTTRLVNQALQNRGIEAFLRTMRDLCEDIQLHLTTVTQSHPGTLRLREIHYIVEGLEGGRRIPLFEAAIEVTTDGSARAGVRLSGDNYVWGSWVREPTSQGEP